MPAAQNNQRYSIMAYNTYSGATIEAYGPMLYNILAIRYLYGANMTWHDGDDVYQFGTDKEYLECIWDAGGRDRIDLSTQTRNQVIDLRAGTFNSVGVKNNGQTGNGNVSIAFKVEIEDAVGGSGDNKITGNTVANGLDGGIGNDTMVGGAGNDTMAGGAGVNSMNGEGGDDLYRVNVATDKVIELLTQAKGGGIDTIESEGTYSLALLANVENLTLVGSAINATGNALVNTLIGNAAGNILDGKAGADILKGGAGTTSMCSTMPATSSTSKGIPTATTSCAAQQSGSRRRSRISRTIPIRARWPGPSPEMASATGCPAAAPATSSTAPAATTRCWAMPATTL